MREALAPLQVKRIVVRGIFRRFGVLPLSYGRRGRTVLLAPVVDADGSLLADDVWLALTRTLAALDIRPGVALELRGEVAAYTYNQGDRDYHLRAVRAVRVLESPPPYLTERPDPVAAIRARAESGLKQARTAGDLLAHLQHMLYPVGRSNQGD
jgi:hypothetical protein